MATIKEMQNNNPLLFLGLMVVGFVFFLGKQIRFGGVSYSRRRSLAKARRAKARKRRRTKR
jgi:hypothetical protein